MGDLQSFLCHPFLSLSISVPVQWVQGCRKATEVQVPMTLWVLILSEWPINLVFCTGKCLELELLVMAIANLAYVPDDNKIKINPIHKLINYVQKYDK